MAFRPLPAQASPQLLKQSKVLNTLLGEAQRLRHLQQLLESQLQPAARPHCQIASWRDGTLLLIVSDGHWATRLRYQQRHLQRQLQAMEEFRHLTTISIKVQPNRDHPERSTQSLKLSKQASAAINDAADTVIDPNLRAALKRLASRSENS